MAAPTVSVLITVFNRAGYLGDAIESAVASSYVDWELIIVDDGSIDESVEVARRWATREMRIHVHVNEHNLGDYPNRNRAASLARGRYIKYLDSDDRIMPHGLQRMVEGMERFPDASLGVCDHQRAGRPDYPYRLSSRQVYFEEFLGRGVIGGGPTGAIMRRDAFEAAGGFRIPRLLGDWDMWLRLSRQASVVLMAPDLVWWRRHEGQEIRSGDAEDFYLRQGFEVMKQHLCAADCPLNHDERNRSIARQTQHHARRILGMMLRRRRPGHAWRLFQDSQMSLRQLARGFLPYRPPEPFGGVLHGGPPIAEDQR